MFSGVMSTTRWITRTAIGQKALTRLLQNIEEWKFGKDMAPLLSRLNAVDKPPSQHRRAVELIVEETAGRIYRLMYILVSEFAAIHGGDPTANQTISILKALVVVTGDDNSTLSAKGKLR
jgi:hypothetical protein